MLSINTNLSSLIAQRSMTQSTNSLNLTIERMTTGFKINHSRDNAANYSISTNMDTQISSYNVAEDNCAMGLDMLTTANGSLDLIHSKLQRLRELALQSANDTYGSESQKAINEEANAIVDEVKRVYNTAEYNGKNLFTEPNTGNKTYSKTQLAEMTSLTKAIEEGNLSTGGTYSISSAEELAKLAEVVNNGKSTTGMTFVLANDIDLAQWCDEHADSGGWTPIGNGSYQFWGIFDGNGHVIKNLTIKNETKDMQGLFGYTNRATIKNIGLENVKINGYDKVGSLVGHSSYSSIINCYATGYVQGNNPTLGDHGVGGLVGFLHKSTLENSYATADASGSFSIGGLVGLSQVESKINNCYATGNISGERRHVGGLIGANQGLSIVTNCYASGNVSGNAECEGGLIGLHQGSGSVIENCYALGSVDSSTTSWIGGLVGAVWNNATIPINCARVNSLGTAGDLMTEEEIKAKYTNEFMGFTEENGWVIINGTPYLKGMVPAGVVENTSLQIGINSSDNSEIEFNMGFALDGIDILSGIGKSLDRDYLSIIDKMIETVSAKQTKFGSVQNRLESVLEEIVISRDNLVSSRSTLRDADIAEVSSEYIRQQILQQASATLLSTANQSPSIALQLI